MKNILILCNEVSTQIMALDDKNRLTHHLHQRKQRKPSNWLSLHAIKWSVCMMVWKKVSEQEE